jgi:hypothetical protein
MKMINLKGNLKDNLFNCIFIEFLVKFQNNINLVKNNSNN